MKRLHRQGAKGSFVRGILEYFDGKTVLRNAACGDFFEVVIDIKGIFWVKGSKADTDAFIFLKGLKCKHSV